MAEDQFKHPTDLLPGFVLGSLDPEEHQAVESHLVGCPACQEEAAALRETVGLLTLAAPETAPSPHLRERLIARTAGRPTVPVAPAPLPPVSSRPAAAWGERLHAWWARRPLWQTAAVALALILIISNLIWWQTLSRVQGPPQPGEMMAIALTASDEQPAAAGFLLVSADGLSGAIVVDDLPMLDEEQQYQLWLIRDGERDSGAVFSVDDLGYGGAPVFAPRPLFEYDSLGITIEPAGGSPGPTGARVLHGTLFSP